jgi:cardiolipin synthase
VHKWWGIAKANFATPLTTLRESRRQSELEITMKKNNLKKEIFAIPNLLCYFRILLIPVFCVLYLNGDYYHAAIVLAVASITDKLDGTIARKFNMVTNLGKIIDPMADKLMQFAVALCLATTYPLMIVLAVALVIKELYMGVKGLLNLRSGVEIYSALWFGKMCTVVLFISMIVLVMLPAEEVLIANMLIIVNLVFMLFSLVMYIIEFRRMRMKTLRDRLSKNKDNLQGEEK